MGSLWGYVLRKLGLRRTPLQNFKPVILITGCGSGIGQALARLLHQKTQYRVIATARPWGIDVCLIQPGFIRSNSFQNVYHTEMSHPRVSTEGAYGDYYKEMVPFIERLMRLSPTTPEKIAALILRVIQTENPPLWISATPDAVIFYYIRRLLPRRALLPFLFFCLPGARSWANDRTRKRIRP